MKQIYQQIWKLAKPYYKKGRPMDINHIEWMMKDALLVCKKEKLDDSLLLPLVILHDVGYAETGPGYYNKKLKIAHMKAGKKIAKKILEKVNYPKEKIKKICYYISVHDNWFLGDNKVYENDIILATFTDLDFIWMVAPKGFPEFLKILQKTKKETIKYIENNEKLTARPFSTKTAKELYQKYLKERKKGL